MTDIASLVLKIDAAQADVAATSLDKVTAAGAKAEAAVTSLGGAGRASMGGLSAIPASLQQIEARTEALRSSVDPLYAAQKRLNSQMAEADNLFRTGALGVDEYQRTIRILDDRLNAVSQAQDRLNAVHVKGAAGTRLQTHEAANLGRQFADVGVMLASGQNPFMTLLQQGPQIADILHTSGLSVKEFGKEMGVMLGLLKAVPATNAAAAASAGVVAASHTTVAAAATAATAATASLAVATEGAFLTSAQLAAAQAGLATSAQAGALAETELAAATRLAAAGQATAAAGAAPLIAANNAIATSATAAAAAEAVALAPLAFILAGIAAVAAVFTVGLAVTAQQIDKTGHSASDLQKKLGLTEDQMKRLKKEGHELGVTFGDVLVGTFDFAGKKLAEALKWNDMKKSMGDFYQSAVDWAVKSIRSQVGLWAGFFGGITAMAKALPAAIAEASIGAANLAIRGINWLIDQGREKINALIDIVNNLALFVLRTPLNLPHLPDGKISELANEYAGAGAKLMGAWGEGSKKAARGAMSDFDKLVGEWINSIDAAWLKRNKKVAGDPGKAARGATEKDPFGDLMSQVAAQAVTTDAATKAQLDWNAAVAAGTMTVEEANRARDWAIERAGIEAKADNFSAEQKAVLGKALDKLALSYEAAAAAKAAGEQIGANRQAMEDQARTLQFLEAQIRLIGAGNVQREVELAQLREKQAILSGKGKGYVLTESDNQRIAGAGDVAARQAALAIGQDLYNKSLDYTYERLQQIDDLVSSSMAGLADAFDGMSDGAAKFTRALGGVLGAVNRLAIAEEKARKERKQASRDLEEGIAAGKLLNDQETIKKALLNYADTSKKTTREIEDAQLSAYANMAGAAKGFFEEGSDGYKAMQAVEIAFRAVQFALSLRAMAQGATETVAHVTNSGAKATASVAAGAAAMFEQSGWGGFVGVAAMMAVMAGLGFSGGSGGSAPRINSKANQERQGTGSVLGDSAAKSESIANSLELVAEHTNDMLEYNNQMLRALRAIESSITSVAAAIARSLGVGGALDPKNAGKMGTTLNDRYSNPTAVQRIFNPSGIDLGGLFNASVTRKLVDSGLQFGAQSIANIMASGVAAQFFQTVETRETAKFLGYTYKDKTKNKTQFTEVDADLKRELGLIVTSMRSGVLEAASVLGVTGASAVLDAFTLNIGQISFKGMKGDEISAALEAVFSKLGDDMAGAVIPGLKDLQKAGEGLFETLMRVARQYQVIDTTLSSIGMTFGAVGLSSLAARERLVDLFGSLDDFVDQVSFYSENFLTEAERLAPVQAALTAELARLGITGLDTRDEFKALVQGLDLSSAAGAELFAALMAIAPAFAAITEETQAIADQRDRLSTAYERESSALADTKAQFQDLFKSLGSFKSSLYTGPSAALSPEAQYNASKAEFERIRGLALTGDVNALGDLQNVSQEYLDASRAYFASSQGYFADLEAVRSAVTAAEGIAGAQVDVAQQQLDALLNLVDPILNIRDDIGTVAEEMLKLNQLLGAGSTSTPVVVGGISAGSVANDNAQVVTAIQQTNANLTTLIETTNAAMDQQAAIHAADMSVQQQQIAVLQRQVQEMQENRA